MAPRSLAVLLAACLFGLSLVLVACGGSGDSSGSDRSSGPSESTTPSSPPASNAQLCDTLHALSRDVKQMGNAGSLSEFQTGFEAAQQDFAQLKPAASAAYGSDLDKVQQALDNFDQALKSVGQGGAGSDLQKLGTAAVQLGTAVQQLVTDLPCPSTGSS